MKRTYLAAVAFGEVHLRETLRIVDGLAQAGIDVIPLKGAIGAELLLGDPGLYQTSDIDLLIRPGDLERAVDVLAAQGYRRTPSLDMEAEKAGTYHITISKDAFHIELHWNLVMRYFEADPEFWWSGVRKVGYRGQDILQLTHEKLLLYLIFRLFARGFRPLRYFVLPLGIISRPGQDLDWQKFMQYAESMKMQKVAAFTIKLIRDVFSPDITHSVRQERVAGYDHLRNTVLEGLFSTRVNTHLRMVVFLSLLDSPAEIARVLVRRVLPGPAEIRLRYNIPHGSPKILPYYLLNPLLMLFRKTRH